MIKSIVWAVLVGRWARSCRSMGRAEGWLHPVDWLMHLNVFWLQLSARSLNNVMEGLFVGMPVLAEQSKGPVKGRLRSCLHASPLQIAVASTSQELPAPLMTARIQ